MATEKTDQLKVFHQFSAALTGFDEIDLIGTGVGQEYLDKLIQGAGKDHVAVLLDAAADAGLYTSRLQKIWDDDRLGAMARNIVLMWYLGSWYPLPDSWKREYNPAPKIDEHVVSETAYKEALWSLAVGAHPRGARPPGFGSWSEAPVSGGHDDDWKNEKSGHD